MKIFLALLGVALLVAGCAGSASQARVVAETPVVVETPSGLVSALVGRWVWCPVAPWPIHDVVELEITVVDEKGRGSGVIRSLFLPEQPVRFEVLKDGSVSLAGTKTPVTFFLRFVRVHAPQGTAIALSGLVVGYPSPWRLLGGDGHIPPE